MIDFFLDIPPAKPPFFQHLPRLPFPPRKTRRDTPGMAGLTYPTYRSKRILVVVLFAAVHFITVFVGLM
jgi:hypothetical protein